MRLHKTTQQKDLNSAEAAIEQLQQTKERIGYHNFKRHEISFQPLKAFQDHDRVVVDRPLRFPSLAARITPRRIQVGTNRTPKPDHSKIAARNKSKWASYMENHNPKKDDKT
ncbi:hypothetical protein Nepgr_014689 [Nepenthes gracilis]|uniref:Uncharacterized protein n=1 Tax=Nepenthes gracilis TaxID=150966 RepID=A0AAD3SKH0_NEPGR|nr:hypothetical protein Nepgr_014689 [Nepenthes gracilis]